MVNVAQIADKQLHDPLYLKSVTELGDKHTLVTTRDICATTGLKLVNSGVRFDSSLFQKLLRHKLAPPLDQCLAVENPVTSAGLAAELPALLEQDDWLRPMQSAIADRGVFAEIISKVPLHPAITFKLTVMREKRPELFRHSIYLALVCIYVGIRHGMSPGKLVQLATAALLQNIGILHIDPAFLERNHTLSNSERRHLYAHPLTAWIILKECTVYTQNVLDAVLQHHERLDGSGYPYGLEGDAIGLMGRILAIGEIIASRHDSTNLAFEKMRLEAILKLNSRRYGSQLIGYLDVFYRSDEEAPPCTHAGKQAIQEQLQCLLSAVSEWEELWNSHHEGYLAFKDANKRMHNLTVGMLAAGLDPLGSAESLNGIENSPRTCFEMHVLLDEITWQLHGVLKEIMRRWPNLGSEDQPTCAAHILSWVEKTEGAIKPDWIARLQSPLPVG